MKQVSNPMAWWIRSIFIGLVSLLCLSLGGGQVLASEPSTVHGSTVPLSELANGHEGNQVAISNTSRLVIKPALTNPAETPIPETPLKQISSLDWIGEMVATAPTIAPEGDGLDNLVDQWRSLMQALFADR